jgi:hypothetical protein
MGNPKVVNIDQNRTFSSLLAALIDEIEQSLRTRKELFKKEIAEKLPHLRNAAILTLAGGLLLLTGYLFLALAAVVLIASAFPPNLYRWFFGFLIIGIVTAGFGAIAAFLAKSEFSLKTILPERIIAVLKDDKDWVKEEASNLRWKSGSSENKNASTVPEASQIERNEEST